MEEFQQRVVDEARELFTKLVALDNFIHHSGTPFAKLPVMEQSRLLTQRGFMSCYHRILKERIEAFGA